jgi:hypothetical protein
LIHGENLIANSKQVLFKTKATLEKYVTLRDAVKVGTMTELAVHYSIQLCPCYVGHRPLCAVYLIHRMFRQESLLAKFMGKDKHGRNATLWVFKVVYNVWKCMSEKELWNKNDVVR